MTNLLLGWPNRFTSGVLAASAQEAALPVTNLANDQGGADQALQIPGTAGWFQVTVPAPVPWRAFSIHRTNLTYAATWRVRVWLGTDTTAAPVFDSGMVSAGIVAGYQQAVMPAPADVMGQVVRFDLSDPANPDGFLNIPLAFAGPAWQPIRNQDWQSSAGRASQASTVTTRSGAVIVRSDWIKRTYTLVMSAIGAAEVWPYVMDLDAYARRGANVLFVPCPSSPNRNLETLFGQLTPTTELTYAATSIDRRGFKATLAERL